MTLLLRVIKTQDQNLSSKSVEQLLIRWQFRNQKTFFLFNKIIFNKATSYCVSFFIWFDFKSFFAAVFFINYFPWACPLKKEDFQSPVKMGTQEELCFCVGKVCLTNTLFHTKISDKHLYSDPTYWPSKRLCLTFFYREHNGSIFCCPCQTNCLYQKIWKYQPV